MVRCDVGRNPEDCTIPLLTHVMMIRIRAMRCDILE